ncbi:MAG: MBL fold metallo-hydrolase [Evtepia gabavorous]
MRVTILVDNLAARGLEAEWGLSIYVEYQGHAILLDTGASDRFARNADTLGIDLSTVSFGVLSHAHWDHGNGMGTFFARNPTAPFYLRQGCGETCYDKTPEGWRYEGLQRGLLTTFAPRIRYVTGDFSPLPGVTLLPHKTPGLAQRGLAANMYRKVGDQWLPDDFSHEQSLVFSTPKGLVIFSGCHGGADNIVRVADTFPAISAIVGGFHLRHPRPGGPGLRPPAGGDRGNPSNHRTLHRARGPGHPDPGLGQPGAAPLHRVGADLLTAAETYMYSQKHPL